MSRKAITIDAWATLITPDGAKRWPEDYLRVFRKYRSPRIQYEGQSIEETVADMDASGIDRCVLSAFYHKDLAVISNDEVAGFVKRYPERFIVGCHLGQPWHDEMMILAWMHDNIYIETSARLPKHWPPAFVDFVKGRGQDKVMWATDYPLLPFKRTLEELDPLGLPDAIYHKLVRHNAMRAFNMMGGKA